MSAHNEELSDLYLTEHCSGHQIEKNETGGACSTYGEKRERAIYTAFWWRDLRERPLGRPRRRWEDIIKKDLQEVVWRDWGHGLD